MKENSVWINDDRKDYPENLIKLAIAHNYAKSGNLPKLDKDYPDFIYEWAQKIINREDVIFANKEPLISQVGIAKQDEDTISLVIGNTMHVLDFMIGYFFTHEKGGLYTLLGEIGPYDDIVYAELFTRGYLKDYNVRTFYACSIERTLNSIKAFCSLEKKKKIYILLNEDDYGLIPSFLKTIDEHSTSPTTVFLEKDFEFVSQNELVKIIDFHIEEKLQEVSFKISEGLPIYTSEFCNFEEYFCLKEEESEHIFYFNPSWGAQYLIYKYGDERVVSKATLLSKVSSWERIFMDNLLEGKDS